MTWGRPDCLCARSGNSSQALADVPCPQVGREAAGEDSLAAILLGCESRPDKRQAGQALRSYGFVMSNTSGAPREASGLVQMLGIVCYCVQGGRFPFWYRCPIYLPSVKILTSEP